MIIAKNFRIEEHPDAIHAKFDLLGPGFPTEFAFLAHPSNAEAVDIDEPNWAALALLYQAMLMGEELVIEADLSPTFLNNVQNDLQELIHNYQNRANLIKVTAGQTAEPKYNHQNKHVSTGFSGGVDSSATYVLYSRPELPVGVRITALSVFHVGALGGTAAEEAHLLVNARARCQDFADTKGLKVFSVAADLNALHEPAKNYGSVGFAKTVGFRNAAAALLLQKELGTYLPSPNVGYDRASYQPQSTTENLDSVLQPLCSTEALRFQAGGAGLSRDDKTALIANLEFVQERLDVCVGDYAHRYQPTHVNCSRCWKCAQTMNDLDQLGVLDKYHRAFDLDYFRANRKRVMEEHYKRKRRSKRRTILGNVGKVFSNTFSKH